MEKLYKKFGKEVEFLAINVSFKEDIEEFIRKYHLTLPVAYDEGGKVASLFDAKIETNVLIDRNGVITFKEREFPEDLDERLQKMLAIRQGADGPD